MDAATILLILTGVGNLGIGLFVYFNNRKSRINFLFGILAFALVIWITLMIIFRNFEFSNLILWAKLLYSSAILAVLSLLIFSLNFPEEQKRPSWLTFFILILGSIILVLITIKTDLIIAGAKYNYLKENTITFGNAYWVFFSYVSAYVIMAIVNIFLKFKNLTGIQKKQVGYFLLGLSITAFISLIFNLTLPTFDIFDYQWYGQVSTFIMLGLMTYAIMKYHLLDIKLIAAELFGIILSIILLINALIVKSLNEFIVKFILFLAVGSISYMFIRSTIKEVKQREKLEALTKELEKKNEKLEELDKVRSEFLSFASHQVKAPMTAVKGFASMIYEGSFGKVSEKAGEAAKRIQESADRLIALVNNLLDLRQIEQDKLEFNFERLNLGELIEDIVEEFKQLAEKNKLQLIFNPPKEKIVIQADPHKFRQVIQNIIHNAIQYTEKGWVEVSVQKEDNKNVLISVSDSGRGISKQLLPNLFKQFSRDSKLAKELQGTGLGLYIAKKIVDGHNGKIWAESRGVNQGSTFYVRMPIS